MADERSTPPSLPPRTAESSSTSHPVISPRRDSLPPAAVAAVERSAAQQRAGSTGTMHEAVLQHAAREVDSAMRKVVEHVRTEILAATDDFNVLQTMTAIARDEYIEFNDTAMELIAGMGKVQQTYSEIDERLKQITDLEQQVSNMEQVVAELDGYTKQLEESFKRKR
ncbi:hypothetical protein HDU87_006327 [Geranomyces variabilis]|uniref:Uncharacterized protein n=1 Tax=Geranomyces variabilis TaxID=109894 RepID=A0AAD5XKG7_9FUNG|nr:hypothetical protein HDU87_006327 [Geranomyces variabilis]